MPMKKYRIFIYLLFVDKIIVGFLITSGITKIFRYQYFQYKDSNKLIFAQQTNFNFVNFQVAILLSIKLSCFMLQITLSFLHKSKKKMIHQRLDIFKPYHTVVRVCHAVTYILTSSLFFHVNLSLLLIQFFLQVKIIFLHGIQIFCQMLYL